jgi:hypothetical protein
VQITAGPISKVSVNTARQNVNIENLYVAPTAALLGNAALGTAAAVSCSMRHARSRRISACLRGS